MNFFLFKDLFKDASFHNLAAFLHYYCHPPNQGSTLFFFLQGARHDPCVPAFFEKLGIICTNSGMKGTLSKRFISAKVQNIRAPFTVLSFPSFQTLGVFLKCSHVGANVHLNIC